MALQNLNGKLIDESVHRIVPDYQGVFNGRALQLDFRMIGGELVFAEPSYFHLMACMRKLRMQIPMDWTPDFFYSTLKELAAANNKFEAIVHFHVFERMNKSPGFLIRISDFNSISEPWNIEVFKDLYIYPSVISALPTPRADKSVARTYAEENDLNDLLFLNTNKKIAHTLKGNLFALINDEWCTTPLASGAYESVWREQLIQWSKKKLDYKIMEKDLIAFDLQKAEECFVLVEGYGIYSIDKFRKKEFPVEQGKALKYLFEEEMLGT